MTLQNRPIALSAGTFCLALLLASCTAPAQRTAGATPGPVTAQSEPAPAEPVPSDSGWAFPVTGAVLPERESQMPNAPRGYRGGTHEGIDIYNHADGTPLACGEDVLNAAAGWVVRADHEWKTMVLREFEGLTAALKNEENPAYLDRLRGRQVWVRTANGTVARYCHLSAIEEAVQVGLKIEGGLKIGAAGNTGTYDGAVGSSRNCHLHFEVWPSPDAFLGKGRAPKDALSLYARLIGTGRK